MSHLLQARVLWAMSPVVQAPPGAIALQLQPQTPPALLLRPALCPRSFVAFDTWMHDVSLAVYTESSVLANGRGLDLSIDTQGGFLSRLAVLGC